MEGRTQYPRLARIRRRILLAPLLLLIALLLVVTAVPLQAAAPKHELVRWYFKDQSQLQKWVDNGLDVWEVDGDSALISVASNQKRALKAEGLKLATVAETPNAAFPACYRTYDDMLTFFHERDARYPTLFHWENIGGSWENQNGLANRFVYVARLTSAEGPENKPRFLLVAEHHAREIITPEVAMKFIDDLLDNYQQDPTVTWLLDNREIWVIPMANPDGYARAVDAEDWRKNTNRTDLCSNGAPPNSYGVDLNRNYSYEWGLPVGASSEPCNLTYRGEAPFSEPETQAIRDLVEREHFDLIISLHSYGNFILYPWAHTWHPVPQADTLNALASRMAGDSGYIPMQATGIGYLASGDLTDWTYGEYGIPSFTFEIGDLGDGGFWPPCGNQQILYQEVRPALMYAAMATDRPYDVAGGPDARQIVVQVNAPRVSVRARVSDWWTGRDRIASAELFVGTLGEPGTGVILAPSDGVCDTETEWLYAELDESVFMRYAGRRVPMFVTAQDVTGKRGVPSLAWLDLRDYYVPSSYGVRVWERDSQVPTFEIKDDYVYQGPANKHNILMTVRDGHLYSGEGTTGELIYTFDNGRLRAGEDGPVVYTLQDNQILRGDESNGTALYQINHDRLVLAGGYPNEEVLTADVNLASQNMDPVCLVLALLMDGEY